MATDVRRGAAHVALLAPLALLAPRLRAQGALGHLVTAGDRCVAPGAERAGAELATRGCPGAPRLARWADGTLRTPGGWCVDFTNPGGPAHLAACAPGRGSQRWRVDDAGPVRSAASDVCLDVEGGRTADGTRVLAWRCAADGATPPSQRFRWRTGA